MTWAILTAPASSVSARMRDADCVQFLQWALPRLDLRWDGFRKVRRQVCRRISRRLAELGLSDGAAYRTYIEGNADEWDRLDGFCRITISRFWRDPAVFQSLRDDVLPVLGPTVSVWSAGCASNWTGRCSRRRSWTAIPGQLGRWWAFRQRKGSKRSLPR